MSENNEEERDKLVPNNARYGAQSDEASYDNTRSSDDVKAEVCETPDTDPRMGTTQHGQYEALHIGGSADRKHTTGIINDYEFTLRVDGDAPDELVAQIESALADVKAEVEDDGT